MGVAERAPLQSTAPQVWQANDQVRIGVGQVILAQVVDGGADIDISGLEFDFVRSIRVWDVRYYSHRERGRDDDCSESHNMRLGTYGSQGDFGWQRTTPAAAASAKSLFSVSVKVSDIKDTSANCSLPSF